MLFCSSVRRGVIERGGVHVSILRNVWGCECSGKRRRHRAWSAVGRARRGEAKLITCAATCGECMRLFILALERSDIQRPFFRPATHEKERPPQGPPAAHGPLPCPAAISLSMFSFHLHFFPFKRSELVPPASCNAGLSSSDPVVPPVNAWDVCFTPHQAPSGQTTGL